MFMVLYQYQSLWFNFVFSFAAIGAENSEKIDENSDKEMEIEESSEKIKVQTAPKVEEEQDLKVCVHTT